jgi:uncharacterized protein (TIGR02453 family)
MTTATRPFSPALFTFLRQLKANNDREWFNANKSRYEEVIREPALDFIAGFAPLLHRISPHFVADARPVGGSLFRIHRDTRFSKDKTPYKTHTGIQFRHEAAKDVHAPGYYVHLEPGLVMVAAGVWHPDANALSRIRSAIDAEPVGWRRATTGKRFRERFELGGDSLKRPPAGFAADHPLIEDLKRKDFVATARLEERDVTAPDFDEKLIRDFRAAVPLVAFLCEALELPF